MADVPLTFELEEFEYLPATAGTALVRVAGRWQGSELDQPALLVRTPFGDDRIEPLPDSAGAPVSGAPWRAAFSLALHVITSGNATFFLDDGGAEIELPQPSERGEPGFDRVAAGRELGELRAANERLSARVAELEGQLEAAQHDMKPRQARTLAKAKEEAERERILRVALEERLEAELARGGDEHAVVADLRAERDRLRGEGQAARSQAAEGARLAERHLQTAREAATKLEAVARQLTEARARAADAEQRAVDAEKGLEYARAAVAAAVASEAGDERASAALAEARREAERAQLEAAALRDELDALKVANAKAVELVESRAEETFADARAELTREVVELKRRTLRAEREAADATKARDRALEEARKAARRAPSSRRQARERSIRERPPRERPPRQPTPTPVAAAASEPMGPPLAERLEFVRQEEMAAMEEVERLRDAGIGSDEPAVEAVDAAAELERASAERESLERQLEAARENVERVARSQLKRSSRGALRDVTTSLAANLAEGEEVLHLAAGGQKESRRLVAATDRRLLVFEGLDSEPEAVRYDEVESVQAARRGALQVSTKRGQFRVEQVSGDFHGLVQHINEQIWDVLHRAGEEAASPPADREEA